MAPKMKKKKSGMSERKQRMALVQSDPIFHEMPKKEKKVKVDPRFRSMFEDEEFSATRGKVDKRGRPLDRKAHEKLDNVYEMDSDESGAEEEAEKPAVVKKAPLKSLDLARGEGNALSSSEDDESDRTDGEAEEEDEEDEFGLHDRWGALDHDVRQVEWTSRRLAVCNLDWERMSAEDVFMALHRPTGRFSQVDVFLSDFGREQLDYEQKHGPKLPQKTRKTAPVEKDDELPADSIRAYQMDRCRFYYAVVTCDSKQTAASIYESCDGFEYLNSGIRFDLRFIPDDMQFEKERLRDRCAPNAVDLKRYTPKHFRSAIVRTNAKLDWDDGDFHRKKKIQRANLIGSGSEDEEEEANGRSDAARDLLAAAGIDRDGREDDDEEEAAGGDSSKRAKKKKPLPSERKKQKRKRLADAAAKLPADLEDDRFAALYADSAFAIDKTHSQFKGGALAHQQVAEKRRRKGGR
ncbi:ESF1-like protein [Aphelenchoides fujianensis]|nr:ESF1-like protein [Aphelenchoides fujianensis]